MLGCSQTWADSFRWPNYTAIDGTAGVKTAEDYPMLLDNNTGTKWCVTGVSGAIHIDIDATRPIKPSGYVLTTGNDTGDGNGARNPKSWNIYWSDDKTNWTLSTSVSNGGMPQGSLTSKTFTFDFGVTHRYWRFEVTSLVSGTTFQLSEFSFLVDHTNLRHVFVAGLEKIYYLAPGQSTINPQLTLRDLQGNTPAMGTNWTAQYQNANGQIVTSLGEGTYRLLIKPAANSHYYSDQYSEETFKVAYIPAGSGTQSNPYTISSVSDWQRLVSSLNAGKTFEGQYVSLLGDLDLENPSLILPSIMAADDYTNVYFSGTFLGNNHTITQTASYSERVVGLFRWVRGGATFRDLTVAGSLSSSQKFMAGFVGAVADGDITFENCHVTATLTSTVNGDGTNSPFVSYMNGYGTATFRNCSFRGSFIGSNTHSWSGIMGYGEGGVCATFTNCIFAPTTVNINSYVENCTYARGRSGFTQTLGEGCYCTYQLDTPQGILVYAAQQEGINKIIHAADGKDYYMTCTVSGIQSQYTYSGESIFPVPTVTAFDGTVLTEGTDYTLTYSDPTGRYPGEQTLTITANGTTYVGSKTIAYTVVRDPSLPELQPGDVNYDDSLTIADVTILVNMVRGELATNALSDVDGNGNVNIEDVKALVAIILGNPYRLALAPTMVGLKVGDTATLTVTLTPAGQYTVTWATSNAEVATVSSEGVVTAVGSGRCEITASCGGLTATCSISIYSTDDYVDLGLPSGTLWATKNVGATEPKGYGSYFAWGETEPKETFSWDNYFDSNNGSSSSFIRYNTGSNILMRKDDAATVNWGAAWQMPSKAEIQELLNSTYTTCEVAEIDGYNGYRITSKVNGNSIFLPAAGYKISYTMGTGNNSYYWTNTQSNLKAQANYLCGDIRNSYIVIEEIQRYYGMPVRPILSHRAVRLTSIQLSKSQVTIGQGMRVKVAATVLPADAETQSVAWTTSDAQVATVDEYGIVTAIAIGSCTITATALDGSGVSASCAVTVEGTSLDGHEYVDLGLRYGTLWATCNIGATSPEQSGLYFAWGDTIGYAPSDEHEFNWKNYVYSYKAGEDEEYMYDPNQPPFYLSKYNDASICYDGIMDRVTDLMAEDDAAFANWGTNWRMPTDGQMGELFNRNYTTWTLTTQNGVQGLLITSLTYPDRSIFFPAVGHYGGSDLQFHNDRSDIRIWTRTGYDSPDMMYEARYMDGGHSGFDIGLLSEIEKRCEGMPVRPVVASGCVETITLPASEITLTMGDTIRLTATVLPNDALDKDIHWISGNTSVAEVDDGLVNAVAPGKCKITVQANNGGVAACCLVTVVAPQVDGHGYMDLGLPSGTLWATCNIGADNPEDSGLYFAWGDTIGHTIGYSFDYGNYIYGARFDDDDTRNPDGYNLFFTKYCSDSEWGYNGFTDTLTELETSDDAAYVKWSANWRMPTKTQVEELINSSYTDAVWTKQNGVNGYRITSKITGYIGNSIFLPAAGYGLGTYLMVNGENGFCWTRTLNQNDPQASYDILFHSSGIECNTEKRSIGLPVRPVTTRQ